MSSKEIKNEFVNCIEGTHTLNLAISVLEERDLYMSIIKEVREYLPKVRVSCSYELDEKIDDLIEILDKVEEK